MSESFPFQEERDEIIDLTGKMQEEMDLYPTEAEFRLSLKGLRSLYHSPAILETIDHFALIAGNLQAQYVDKPTCALRWTDMFAAGGLLGMHVSMADLPDVLPARMHTAEDPEIDGMTITDATDVAKALEIIANLQDLQTAGFDPDDREVVAAAAQLYSLDSDESDQYMFALGYRFAVNKVIEISEYFDEFDFLILDYEDAEKNIETEAEQSPTVTWL